MISSVWLGPVENPLNDNADVTVELADGRKFSFTAHTPLNLMSVMDSEALDYFLSEDLLILRTINEANVRAAVEEMLEDGTIARFGTLSS